MKMTATEEGHALVVIVEEPRLDAAVAVRFKDQMRELTGATTTRVILDLSQVDFLDSSGLGAVVGAMKQLGDERRLDLAALTPMVDKVFRMTRMDTVFRIFPDRTTALWDAAHAS